MGVFTTSNIDLVTPLSADEVRKVISKNIQPNHSDWKRSFDGGFSSENEFIISRVIWYRNSFLPQLHGKITSLNDGTKLELRCKLHLPVLVFLWIFIAFGTLMFLLMLPSLGHIPIQFPLTAIGIPLFGFTLASISFKMELKRSITLLSDLLRAKRN